MNIAQIIDKYTCLDYLEKRVVRKTKDGFLCRAPWREDKHPSLTITANGKGWKDHVTGEHGNIIDLIAKDKGISKSQVCKWFDSFIPSPSSSFYPQKSCEGKEKESFVWFEVGELHAPGLFAYLTKRHINTSIAHRFLKEAHYSFKERINGSYLYALAFPNDVGGYELRSEQFKGGTSPKGITTHMSKKNASCVVFEGFMDMLSFATLCKDIKHNYVVLNSIVNVPSAIEALKEYPGTIYLCLDNDNGGSIATKQLLDAIPSAIDIRTRFAPWKDINDYLMHKG